MSAVLASPCRIKQNHRRRRRIVSGRRQYNYFRDYDATTGRYVESDPIGLRGGISTFGYVGGNPLTHRDPFGLVDPSLELYAAGVTDRMPARIAPQPVVDYLSGGMSYIEGLYTFGEIGAWESGLFGEELKERGIRDDKLLDAAIDALSNNAQARKQAWCFAKNWAQNHKAFLAGRYSAGVAGGAVTGTGPLGGATLSTVAATGSALGEIDNGANSLGDILNAAMNGGNH